MPPLQYKIVRSMRNSLALSISPEGSVIVKAPFFTTKGQIEAFIASHRDWIDKHIAKTAERKILLTKQYVSGDTFWYLGNKITLKIGNYQSIHVVKDTLFFPQILEFRIKKELTNWYIRYGKTVVTDRLEWYAKAMKATYTDVTFSDTRSQWGRCTHDNRLQFSWRLGMAPILAINYVVVHELAHTFQKNHSRSFWSIVRFHNPTYRQQILWLKNHGQSLVI